MSSPNDNMAGTNDDSAKIYSPTILTVNVCGLRTSWPDFSHHILSTRPLAALVVETLISHDVINTKCKINGYRWVACTDSPRGVAILLANQISYKHIIRSIDCIFLKLTIRNLSFSLLGGYQSPNRENGVLSNMAEILHNYQISNPHDDLLTLGDFNARHRSWDTKTNKRGRLLFQISHQFNLSLLNTPKAPTYFRRGCSSTSTIDLAFTNNTSIFQRATVLRDTSLGSDHVPVEIVLDIPPINIPKVTRRMLNTKNISEFRFNEHILQHYDSSEVRFLTDQIQKEEWEPEYPMKIMEAADRFTRTVSHAIDATIGFTEVDVTVTQDRPFWWSPKIDRLRQKKEALEIRMRDNGSRSLRREHELISRKFHRSVQASRTCSWRNFCGSAEDQTKIFSLYKRSLGRKPIPSFISDESQEPCVSPRSKAKGFNETMAAISRFPTDVVPPADIQTVRTADAQLKASESTLRWNNRSSEIFGIKSLRNILDRSKSKRTAPGADHITTSLLALLNDENLQTVSLIFRCLHAAGVFPGDWKKALLSPIPKTSTIAKASDMRPIALVSCLGKLYERAHVSIITEEAESLGVIPQHQAAFRKGRNAQEHVATVTQLISSMSNRETTIALYLDISKAYNSVWHSRLLTQMNTQGFSTYTTRFIRSWLTQREYRTRMDGAISDPAFHDRGVPQGTVLSPIIFNIYFSGVLRSCSGLPLLYADDAAIFLKVSKNNIERGLRMMQENAERVHRWCASRSLAIHPGKCNLMIYTRSRSMAQKADAGEYSIRMASIEIHSAASVRYLGVIFDTRLNFAAHCSTVLGKVKRRTALILRLGGFCWGCPPRYMLRLYQAIVLPTVQYFSPAFLLAPRKFRSTLASSQKAFAKRILSLPRCAGGLTAEVYANLLPIELYLQQSTLRLITRLMYKSKEVNKRIMWYATSWAAALPEIAEYGQRSLARLYLSLLHKFDIPLLTDLCHPQQPPASRPLPDMPQLHKHRSPWHFHQACMYAQRCCDSIPVSHNKIFTDGSITNGVGGAAVHAEFASSNVDWSCRVTGQALSSTTVELVALLQAIDMASEALNPSTIISDSQTAIRVLHRDFGARLNNLGSQVSFVWVPSHTSLMGNDIADDLAITAAADPDFHGEQQDLPLTYAAVRTLIRRKIREAVTKLWQDSDQSPELHMFFPKPPRNLRHIVADSQSSRQIARLRCGYCNSNVFLNRHGLRNYEYCEYCYLMLGLTRRHDVSHAFCSCPEFAIYNAIFRTEIRLILDLDPSAKISLWQALVPQKYESKSIRLSNIICTHALRVSQLGCF